METIFRYLFHLDIILSGIGAETPAIAAGYFIPLDDTEVIEIGI